MAGQARYEAALKEYNSAAQTAPHNFDGLHLCRAVTLAQLRRYAEAEKDLENVIRHDPNGPAATTARQLLSQVQAAANR